MTYLPAMTRTVRPVDGVRASSLHAIHRLMESRQGEAFPLHVGEPYLRMPEVALDAYVRALRDGKTRYTDAPGMLALREALAARLAGNGAPAVERLFVTPGSCQAIAAVLQSVAIPGGIAVLPRVHWPMHLQQVVLAGLTPRFVDMSGHRAEVTGALEELAGLGACVIIVNSPANPAGTVLDRELVGAIHDWASRRGIWVISDEAYEDFTYEGSAPATAEFDLRLPAPERVVFSVHTFSKGYSMTGCRLGYVAAPTKEAADRLTRIQEATLVSPSTPVQYAGLAALTDQHCLREHSQYVRMTRDAMLAEAWLAGQVRASPAGGWYILIDLARYTADTDWLCRELIEQTGVAVAPGEDFFPPGDLAGRSMVRLTMCHEREMTLEGIHRLREFLEAR